MKTVDEIVNTTLKHEGGYVNHPNDKGGPTNFGVTQATYSAWLGRPASIEEVRQMDIETAKEIYLKNFFYGPRVNALPERIQGQVFDMCINHGPRNAIKMVQGVINAAGFGPVDVDGVLGPQSVKKISQACDEMGPYLNNAISEAREAFFQRIVDRNASQSVFLKGWLNRARSFREEV